MATDDLARTASGELVCRVEFERQFYRQAFQEQKDQLGQLYARLSFIRDRAGPLILAAIRMQKATKQMIGEEWTEENAAIEQAILVALDMPMPH